MKTLKRTLIPILSAAMLLTTITQTAASDRPESTVTVTVDGKVVDFPDQQPVILNDRTMIPLRAVAEILGCNVEWLEDSRTVRITTVQESDILDRLSEHGFPMSPDENSSWYIKRDENLVGYCPEYECEIVAKKFDRQTLDEISEALKIIYPTGYETVRGLMMRSIRGELWECLRDNAGYLASGTFGTHYIDDREVNIYVKYGLGSMTITINKPGYVNPEKPLELDAETISDLTTEAKKFYPLGKYDLD